MSKVKTRPASRFVVGVVRNTKLQNLRESEGFGRPAPTGSFELLKNALAGGRDIAELLVK